MSGLYVLTPPQKALLRRLPDRPSDGRMVKGAALRVAKNLRDRGLAVCTGWNHNTGRHWYARTDAGEAALHLPENQGNPHRRPTPVQRRLLKRLADGYSVIDEGARSHVTPGGPGRIETTLSLMAERGWIDWSEGIAEITITSAGRALL